MKRGKFRNVEFTMERMSGYGHYSISARYRGKSIQVTTTDSEAWDWIDDEEDRERHNDARRHCYMKIVEKYKKDN